MSVHDDDFSSQRHKPGSGGAEQALAQTILESSRRSLVATKKNAAAELSKCTAPDPSAKLTRRARALAEAWNIATEQERRKFLFELIELKWPI